MNDKRRPHQITESFVCAFFSSSRGFPLGQISVSEFSSVFLISVELLQKLFREHVKTIAAKLGWTDEGPQTEK